MLFGATGELKEQTIDILKTKFKDNDIGEPNWLLGIQINLIRRWNHSIPNNIY